MTDSLSTTPAHALISRIKDSVFGSPWVAYQVKRAEPLDPRSLLAVLGTGKGINASADGNGDEGCETPERNRARKCPISDPDHDPHSGTNL